MIAINILPLAAWVALAIVLGILLLRIYWQNIYDYFAGETAGDKPPPEQTTPASIVTRHVPPPLPKDRFQALSNKLRGTVTFDYSNDDGRYRIGEGRHMFTTIWTKGNTDSIYLYKGGNVCTVAVTDKQSIDEIEDASEYDGSSIHRTVQCGHVAVLQNAAAFWAAVKVLNIEDDTRGSDHDELMLEYVIQADGTPNFKELRH